MAPQARFTDHGCSTSNRGYRTGYHVEQILYGHTVSTSKIQEMETAVGELHQQEGDAQIPSNIVKHVPAMFVFDNNDFQEETPTPRHNCANHSQALLILLH